MNETEQQMHENIALGLTEIGEMEGSGASPFDLLMAQIEGMKNRANKYRKQAQENGDMEEEGQQMRAYMCLKELHRLGRFFEANIKAQRD